MKRAALAVALVMTLGTAADARRAAPPPTAGLVQLTPDRFALEASVLVDLAVEGLAGRLQVTKTPDGYRIDAIAPGSPLVNLGLAVGDVVRSINGVALTNRAALRRAQAVSRTSRVLTVEAMRGTDALTLRYRIVANAGRLARFAQPVSADDQNLLALMSAGVKRVDATRVTVDRAVLEAVVQPRARFGDAVSDPVDGLIVYRGESLLTLLGLQVFDRIDELDGVSVTNERGLMRDLAAAGAAQGFALTVQRNGVPLVIQYTVAERMFDSVDLRAAVAPPPSADAVDRDAFLEELDKGIKKKSDSHFVIQRSLVDKVLANPMLAARGARIVPSIKNGKANGFKLYAIRPSAIYAKVGFMNGDTLHSINGMELTTPDKALEVYTKLRSARSLKFDLTRRGKPVKLRIDIK